MSAQPFPTLVIQKLTLLVLLISCINMSCSPDLSTNARTAYINATIWTGDQDNPMAEALLIEGNKLVAVGSTASIEEMLTPNDEVIDAGQAFISPGFIDSHVHFITGGYRLASVQLRDAKTPEEFTQRIADFAATLQPGEWITGGDWDHEQWGGELPTRDWIDKVTPDNPVMINRLDGHMVLSNSKALELAGVTKDTEEVYGGTIVRGEGNRPTGILKDNAMQLVEKVRPPASEAQQDRALQAAMDYVNAQGVTSVHHVGLLSQLPVFERARAANNMTTRIYAATELANWEGLRDHIDQNGKGDDWYRIGGLKGFVDGSLGSHTAAFFEPFSDAPDDAGFFITTEDDLYNAISGADGAGLHAIVHAIGDRANHTLLNIFERVADENGQRDRRFRIEHVQHLAKNDIGRFKDLGVIASMQPYHAIDDGRWAERVIGPERIKTTYAFRSLIDAGAHLTFGSDWFVAPPLPLMGIYAAVTRRTLDDANPEGWVPEQKITVDEALRSFTINAAYASFEEDIKGSLEAGKLADFVLIDKNLLSIPAEDIKDAQILRTVVDGKTVYEAQ